MRASHLLYLAAFAALAVPAGAATVTGEAKILLGGEAARCVGVALVPRTAASERAIVGMFGTAAATSRSLTAAELLNSKETVDFQRSKDARCSYRSGYRFENVAPGDYFVLLHARGGNGGWGSLGSSGDDAPAVYETGFRDQAVLLMQPVSVSASGRMVKADFRHKN